MFNIFEYLAINGFLLLASYISGFSNAVIISDNSPHNENIFLVVGALSTALMIKLCQLAPMVAADCPTDINLSAVSCSLTAVSYCIGQYYGKHNRGGKDW